MLQIVMKLIGTILVLLGIILIYDARMITKRFFGFGDQNDAAQGLKILGFLIAIVRRINCIFCVKLLDK